MSLAIAHFAFGAAMTGPVVFRFAGKTGASA